MERNVSMDEISDGRLYGLNDMVKADCRDCEGCSACCRGMGTSIVLDPLDIYRLTAGLGESFEKLLAGGVELNLADGMILPNLRMAGEKEQCVLSIRSGLESAGFSRWAVSMKTEASGTFSRSMNAAGRTGAR